MLARTVRLVAASVGKASRTPRNRATVAFMAQERRFVRSFFGVSSLGMSSLAALTVAAALSTSCKDKPADTAPTTTDAAVALPTASAPVTAMADGGGGDGGGNGDHEGPRDARGGPGSMLFQAARSLDLSADQKAKVAAAETTAKGGGEASRDAMKTAGKDLHTDLVAGVRAGKIESSKLEPRYAAIEKVVGESQAKEADALNALHAALDATQRKAAVANVRAKQTMREEKMAHREGGDGGAADGGKPAWSSKRSVDRLLHGLDLDADQQKKVDAVVAKEDAAKHPDPAEMKKNMDAMLTAFEKDTFDAKKLDLFDAKKMRGPMEQETKLLGQLVPILKPEQREKLAARMEKGPSPHAGRGAGFRPRPMLEEGEDE